MTEIRSSAHDRPGRVVGALLLIALGGFFFLQQQNLIPASFNWWAIFMLVPGVVALFEAFMSLGRTGRIDIGRAIVGGILTALGVVFLFSLPLDLLRGVAWPLVLPVFLIGAGLVLLLRR